MNPSDTCSETLTWHVNTCRRKQKECILDLILAWLALSFAIASFATLSLLYRLHDPICIQICFHLSQRVHQSVEHIPIISHFQHRNGAD